MTGRGRCAAATLGATRRVARGLGAALFWGGFIQLSKSCSVVGFWPSAFSGRQQTVCCQGCSRRGMGEIIGRCMTILATESTEGRRGFYRAMYDGANRIPKGVSCPSGFRHPCLKPDGWFHTPPGFRHPCLKADGRRGFSLRGACATVGAQSR